MFTKYVSDQEFGSRIYRQLLKLVNKKTNNPKKFEKKKIELDSLPKKVSDAQHC